MKGYILLIAGGENCMNYKVFSEGVIKAYEKWGKPAVVMSDTSSLTGQIAIQWAAHANLPIMTPMPRKVSRAKNATLMVRKADKMVAFVDDNSLEVWGTIKKMRKYPDKDILVFKVNKHN